MAQHDYNIANQTGLEFRADLNELAKAVVTQNSGPTEPAVTYAGMKWLDTSTSPPIEKRRNAANSAWETTLTEAGRAVTGAADSAAQRTAIGAQETLVSGTNIKTINGESVLGSGNITIAPAASFRNKIINGDFRINQRVYVSGAATTAGQYTLDRWKVTGTGGVTFSTTANKTTVTIPSGQTFQQVIEGLNLQTGTYVLSWEGTAQGRIAGGAYGASGAVTASVTGGTNTTIEFNSGTVANVQLEAGSVATPFEHRPIQTELALCQRYYQTGNVRLLCYQTSGAGFEYSHAMQVAMRATPTISYSGITYLNASGLTTSTASVSDFVPSATATAAGAARFFAAFAATIEL